LANILKTVIDTS